LFFCLNFEFTIAQMVTVRGTVRDEASGEALVGANVVLDNEQAVSATNRYGFFSLQVKRKVPSKLTFSHVGHESVSVETTLRGDTTLTVWLGAIPLAEVKVRAPSADFSISTVNVPIAQLRQIPPLLGEVDLLKALQLVPGVSGGREGTTGLNVRGGSPDQNLILLDEAVVYNTAHLFGFVSVFNPDAVKSMELLKANFPARYGGRLSSVLDITLKEGNNREMKGEVSIGPISSKVLLEGPIRKDQTSFLLAGRASYAGLLLLPSQVLFRQGRTEQANNFWLYDLNAKVNHRFNQNHQLFVSFYTGRDAYLAKEGSPQDLSALRLHWGNLTGTARYTHSLSPKLFGRLALTTTRYRYVLATENRVSADDAAYGLRLSNGIRDYSVKYQFDFAVSPTATLRAGLEWMHHRYEPANSSATSPDLPAPRERNPAITAIESAGFVETDWRPAPHVLVNAGARLSRYAVDGRVFGGWEPRASVRYTGWPNWTVTGGYSLMRQYVHLLSNYGIGLPNDLWVPATPLARPQLSHQTSLGLARVFPKTGVNVGLEGYYKRMERLIDFRQGASFLSVLDADWQQLVAREGLGRSYGLEAWARKSSGRLTGWISYTLSWNKRRFDEINEGRWFWANYDRRHNVAITGSYRLSERWRLAATWMYSSGQPVTVPTGLYRDPSGLEQFIYRERNNTRFSDYHRLDVGITRSAQTRRGRSTELGFGLYNAYNRANPFYLDVRRRIRIDPTAPPLYASFEGWDVVQRPFLPILPYVNYAVKF